MVRSGQLWLYKTADLHIIFTLSFDPVDRFWQLKSHFGVVFQAKSNGEVTVHISWLGKTHLLNLWSSWWIPNCQKLWSCVFPCQLMCTVISSLHWIKLRGICEKKVCCIWTFLAIFSRIIASFTETDPWKKRIWIPP